MNRPIEEGAEHGSGVEITPQIQRVDCLAAHRRIVFNVVYDCEVVEVRIRSVYPKGELQWHCIVTDIR